MYVCMHIREREREGKRERERVRVGLGFRGFGGGLGVWGFHRFQGIKVKSCKICR